MPLNEDRSSSLWRVSNPGRVEAPSRAASRRWPAKTVAATIAGLIVLAALIIAPWLFDAGTLRREVTAQIRSTTGLSLTVDGPARFALLPQPHVEFARLHFADPSGTLTIDADAMSGEARLLPLLVGRIEMASVTLDHPHLVINLDGRPMPADSMIGRALRATDGRAETGSQRLGSVTLLDGTAVLKSKTRAVDTLISAINMTVDWRNLDAPATATGTVEFKDVPTDVAAWVAQPSSLLRGDHSPIALRIQSLPLDLSANGEISVQPNLRFHGRISANAPTLAAVLGLAGYEATLPAPFANIVMASDATIGGGMMDLPNLRLRIDANDYEGTLAYQTSGAKSSLAGTLATEQLLLTPFLNGAPPLLDGTRHWNADILHIAPHDGLDLDLRVSAAHLRAPPFTIDDAAFAVMTRDSRTEITLVDAKAYGGAIKGRASIGTTATGLNLRAGFSLNDIDTSTFSWDLLGRQLAAGTLNASANLESTGDSPRALVTNMHGWVKAKVSDGEISDLDFAHGLRELARQRMDSILPALRGGHTSFETFALDAQIVDGVALIKDGTLMGQEAVLRLEGSADLGQRTLDVTAKATAPAADGTTAPQSLRLGLTGTFDQPLILPDSTPSNAVSSPRE